MSSLSSLHMETLDHLSIELMSSNPCEQEKVRVWLWREPAEWPPFNHWGYKWISWWSKQRVAGLQHGWCHYCNTESEWSWPGWGLHHCLSCWPAPRPGLHRDTMGIMEALQQAASYAMICVHWKRIPCSHLSIQRGFFGSFMHKTVAS
jgi:hypothetical protein